MTRFGDNPVTSTVPIPPRRQPRRDTSTRNRREIKLNVTDPDLLIPIKQTRVTTRHLDLREPQPSSSDSQPASLQPVSETTTSESSVSLPSSPSGSSSTESTSTSGTDSSVRLRHHPRAAHSCLQMLRALRQAVQLAHHGLHHPNCLRWSALSTACLRAQEIVKAIPVTRSQMDNLRDQQQRIAVLKQVASQPQNQPTACLSASSCKHATSPISPKTSK